MPGPYIRRIAVLAGPHGQSSRRGAFSSTLRVGWNSATPKTLSMLGAWGTHTAPARTRILSATDHIWPGLTLAVVPPLTQSPLRNSIDRRRDSWRRVIRIRKIPTFRVRGGAAADRGRTPAIFGILDSASSETFLRGAASYG